MTVLHLLNRVLAVVLAVLVVVAAVVVPVEVVLWALGRNQWVLPWRDWSTSVPGLTTDDSTLLGVAVVLAVVGLLLLLFEITPRRPRALKLTPVAEGVQTVATRRGLNKLAVDAASSVRGARSATASVKKRRVKVTVKSRVRDQGQDAVRQAATQAVERRLQGLGVQPQPKVKVDVREVS